MALGDAGHESQAQADAVMPARQRTVELRKQTRDLGLGSGRHAHAIVADLDRYPLRARRDGDFRPAARFGELDRIGNQIEQRLLQPLAVSDQGG